MFASMLGTLLTFIIAFFIFLGFISSIILLAEKQEVLISENTVLKITFSTPIKERTPNNPFELFDPTSIEFRKSLGLNDILKNIKKAADDDNIEGIYIEISSISAGISSIQEIRDAIVKFKESGKWVMCFSDVYSQGAYYLGSVADEIYMHPEGLMELKGLSIESMFLKGTFEKLKIEPQVLRAGKFKGAAEPFLRDHYSTENKEQLSAYANSVWDEITEDISYSRNKSIQEINADADALAVFDATAAMERGYIDELIYKDEVLRKMKNRLNIDQDEAISSVLIQNYTHVPKTTTKKFSRNKVALIYAVGSIIQGRGGDEIIGSVTISNAIKKARQDDNVKAIVMRVNSGGGDGIASDVIWREVMLARNEKPFVISMGDLAASGGYWISCAADKIIADPTTLTGSIGVFAMIPNMKAMFNEHLGVTFDRVETNENASFMSITEPMTDFQISIIENEIDKFYNIFLDRVANGRGMTTEEVHEIAQGRIWSGVDALEIGLIDEFGGVNDAIEIAADMAELDDYRIQSLPEQKDPLQELLSSLKSETRVRNHIKEELGEYYTYYYYLEQMKNLSGVQARIPFEYTIK